MESRSDAWVRVGRKGGQGGGDALDGCRSRGFFGPVEMPVPGAGLGEHEDVATGGGESAGEVLARDAEFVDLAVDHERRREVREVLGGRQSGDRGDRRAVDRAAEVVLVHSEHGVGSERVGLGVGGERGAQSGIRFRLQGQERGVGEHDQRGCQAAIGEHTQGGARGEVGTGTCTPERPRARGQLRLERPAECGDDVVGCRGEVHTGLRRRAAHLGPGGRRRCERVVDRHHRDSACREGTCDPVSLGHVEVAAGEAAAVRPDQTRAVRDHAGRGHRRVHPHESPGSGVGLGHRSYAPQPAWTPPTRSASIFSW